MLIVGAGPAGLECARALGQRGYGVHLAEATTELGGRVARRSQAARPQRMDPRARLPRRPARSAWPMSASTATAGSPPPTSASSAPPASSSPPARAGGKTASAAPSTIRFPATSAPNVFTPDDILAGAAIPGPVVIYDDDHGYMGGVIAEELRRRNLAVTMVIPAGTISAWTIFSHEQPFIQTRLLEFRRRGDLLAQPRRDPRRRGGAGLQLHRPPPHFARALAYRGGLAPAGHRSLRLARSPIRPRSRLPASGR